MSPKLNYMYPRRGGSETYHPEEEVVRPGSASSPQKPEEVEQMPPTSLQREFSLLDTWLGPHKPDFRLLSSEL